MSNNTSFRVLLDLTNLHIESFKYVWISISPREIKTISDFKTSILHKINLSTDNIKLFVRDGLLLDDETVFVLREDDTVHVQYEKLLSLQDQGTSATNEHKRLSKKRDYTECNEGEYLNSKKCKRSSDVFAANENVVCLEDTNCKTKKKHKKKHKLHSVASYDETINSVVDSAVQSPVIHKHKKRKQNSSEEINLPGSSLLQSCNSNFPFETESNLTGKSKNKTTCEADSNIEPFYSAKSKFKDILEKDEVINMKESDANHVEGNEADRKTFTECNTGLPNNCPKKKRKRRRRRKCKSVPEHVEIPPNANNNEHFKSFISSNSECSSFKRKHIIFDSVNPLVDFVPEKSPHVETLNTDDDEKVQNASTDTYVVDDLLPPSFPKVSTPAQSNGCLNPNWHVSLMHNENLNHSYNKNCSSRKEITSEHSKTDARVSTQNPEEAIPYKVNYEDLPNLHSQPKIGAHITYKNKNCSSRKEITSEHSKTDASTSDASVSTQNPEEAIPYKVNYEDLPNLHSQPKIGAHIAYKILELDENYSPVVSNYREGIVKSINPLSEEIEIELLKHELIPVRTGKFENLIENEMSLPEIIKTDTVVWSSLIEPKLLSRG